MAIINLVSLFIDSHPFIQRDYVFFRQFFGDFALFFVFPVAVLPLIRPAEHGHGGTCHLRFVLLYDSQLLAEFGIVRASRTSGALESPDAVAIAVYDPVLPTVGRFIVVRQPEYRAVHVGAVLMLGITRLDLRPYTPFGLADAHDVQIAVVLFDGLVERTLFGLGTAPVADGKIRRVLHDIFLQPLESADRERRWFIRAFGHSVVIGPPFESFRTPWIILHQRVQRAVVGPIEPGTLEARDHLRGIFAY